MDIINGVPELIHKFIIDVARTNAFLGRVMEYNDLTGLAVEVDGDFVEQFQLFFDNAAATWVVGCWPPQRYAVVSGSAHLPSGSMRVRLAGLDVAVVSFADFRFYFSELRAEIECHGGTYILQGMGTGRGSRTLDPATLSVRGGLEVRCGRGWQPWCPLLRSQRRLLEEEVLARVPGLVAAALGAAHPLPLGPGCPGMLHNTLQAFLFSGLSCCEAPFSTDAAGRLDGGQFNGRVYGAGVAASGVVCTYAGGGRWAGRCDSIPGGYYEESIGVCREDDTVPPPWKCMWCGPVWICVRLVLCLLLLVGLMLPVIAAYCCWSRCKHCKPSQPAGYSKGRSSKRNPGLLALTDDPELYNGH